jgi:hypothetical protein
MKRLALLVALLPAAAHAQTIWPYAPQGRPYAAPAPQPYSQVAPWLPGTIIPQPPPYYPPPQIFVVPR